MRLVDRSGRLIFFSRLNTLIVSRTAAIVAHVDVEVRRLSGGCPCGTGGFR
jgi:hypothetical protein